MPNVPLIETDCWCGIPFAMPRRLYDECLANGTKFYCPLGHSMTFKETEIDKLRQERNRLKQQSARLNDQIEDERRWREASERSAAAYKGQVTKIKKRVSGGSCPCCKRNFTNLRRHMESKHPDYAATELEVIDGGKQTA